MKKKKDNQCLQTIDQLQQSLQFKQYLEDMRNAYSLEFMILLIAPM